MGPKQRGSNCSQRETEQQAKRGPRLRPHKQGPDRAGSTARCRSARVRAKLAKAPKVQNANPLGAALEQMISATATALTAWQQEIVAGVFKLCLVGVMVI